MPTSHPRFQLTETPELSRALDRAARRWPGEPRSKLLLRLVRQGADALENADSDADAQRRAAVQATSGAYADAFPTGFLEDLRQDWPA